MKTKAPTAGELVPSRLPASWGSARPDNLTPGRLGRIIENLSAGDIEEAMVFFDSMEEKDLHIGAVTQTRALAASSSDREVKPATGAACDVAIADFVRDVISEIPRFSSVLTALMSAVSHGFAIAEIIWEVKNGRVIIKNVLPRPQRLFTFIDYDSPVLRNFPAYLDPDSGRPVKLPRSKFIYHKNSSRLHPVDAGLFRGVSWSYLFSNYTLKDWMTFMAFRYALANTDPQQMTPQGTH